MSTKNTVSWWQIAKFTSLLSTRAIDWFIGAAQDGVIDSAEMSALYTIFNQTHTEVFGRAVRIDLEDK